MFTPRRSALAFACGLAAAMGIGLGAAPASAAPVTVYSPPSLLSAPAIDILSATVDYGRSAGSLSATISLRGAPVPLANGGPGYSVVLYGPQKYIGGGAVIALSSVGVPGDARLEVSRANDGITTSVPVRVRFLGNRVEFTAIDDRLAGLDVRYFDVQSTKTRSPEPGSFFGIDGIYGRALR
ncbi:hypothetical protein [Williamsia maris]|uniref:Uncharacterized protein n=1 Tax=Williamsia maris TaxID=72806 RepID=A0ABT1HA32_9NOCA|nr:hypothetical protein [Williamsia maris]MCP2174536.1 hypothetical protein [Williamsia maris]